MRYALKTFDHFDQLLSATRAEVDALLTMEPDDGALDSVKRQLDALHGWTRGGRCPSQDEKDQLNFGQIASRALDTYSVAPALYALASFVIYWGEPGGCPR